MIVISNTSPLRYLIAIGRADLVSNIFNHVLIPRGVHAELTHRSSPEPLRNWMAEMPDWLETRELGRSPEAQFVRVLDQGEAEAIQLAVDLHADYLLIDERRGRQIATARGLTVIGTLGILLESYRRGLIQNPSDVLADLRAARFRVSRRLVQEFEEQIRSMKSGE
jgi:predicted nucleic acid-binding protein